ncbi:M23 family metallopeptidase [Arenimonas sp.]|uniref:M23 family metallopeptidase n=1 Tax=Arenimonas sp. TaxID=1872635 RepID=UPI0039E41A4B
MRTWAAFLLGVVTGALALVLLFEYFADDPPPAPQVVPVQPTEAAVQEPVPEVFAPPALSPDLFGVADADAGAPAAETDSEASALPATDPALANLLIPVQGTSAAVLIDTFSDARAQGRPHDAIDLMAPSGTPVVATNDGEVVKLFSSERGGLTIYQFDPSRRVAYYYAHLDRYAEGLREGTRLRRGDVIAYVGSSGNADPSAPHLHFAIFELGPDKLWWQGRAINPYPLLRR